LKLLEGKRPGELQKCPTVNLSETAEAKLANRDAGQLASRRRKLGLDVLDQRVYLRLVDRPLVGGACQRPAQLLAIERLAPAGPLADEQRLLVSLIGGESMTAARAFAAAPDRGAGLGAAALEDPAGGFAKGTIHSSESTRRGGLFLLYRA
jgi:hypothetical protein